MRIIIMAIVLIMVNGCAGLGLNKKCTVIPDEIWISGDLDPNNNYNAVEYTGGIKWKLK